MGKTTWTVDVLLTGSWRGATSVLVSNGRSHIVVDTGMPHEAHQLVKALEARGLRPTDVKTIINTHFHVDHVLNNSLFPSSLIYAAQQSYHWCAALYSDLLDGANWEQLVLKYYPETYEYEGAREKMAQLRRFALRWWDRKLLGSPARFRWIETNNLPDGLECLLTSGHVPGHLSVMVHTGEKPTIIAGDALLSLEQETEVLTMIPHNREQFHDDRNRILSVSVRILPGHDREFSNASTSQPDPGRPAEHT